MARGVPLTEEDKAAVIAALLTGATVSEIVRALKVPETTVRRLRRDLTSEELAEVGGLLGARLEDLVFEYAAANFKALIAQAEVASDATYLKKAPPQQLALLHTALADQAVRVLDASGRARRAGEKQAERTDA